MEASTHNHDLKRFEGWLKQLEQAFQFSADGVQDCDQFNSGELATANSVLQSITEVIAADEKQQPYWMSKKSMTNEPFVSTATELRERLKRLCLPVVLGRFEQLKEDIRQSRGISTDVNIDLNIQTDVEQPGTSSKTDLMKLLEPNDTIGGFCKLADFAHRLGVVSENDLQRIDFFITRENRRLEKYSQDLSTYLDNDKYYEGTDEGSMLKTALVKANEQLRTFTGEVEDAMAEEEKARLAYEKAIQKSQLAKRKLEGFGCFVDLMGNQSEVMQKVNKFRIALASFNKHSASRRLNMLQMLREFYSQNTHLFISKRFMQDSQVLVDLLVKQVTSIVQTVQAHLQKSSDTIDESMVIILRVALETLRVWRSLSPMEITNQLLTTIEPLERFLHEVMTSVPALPSCLPSTAAPAEQRKTVVLYFEKVFHDTPENHVESQARVATSLKLLRKRAAKLSANAVQPSASLREIEILQCDEISSPPAWCLPLVHSPQYLSHIASLAQEAKTDDLFVPLEFETEWETDYEILTEPEDEDSVKRRRRRSNVRTKRLSIQFDLNRDFVSSIEANTAQQLKKLLTPRKLDISIANTLKIEASSANHHESRKIEEEEGEDKEKNGLRVRTPYGMGYLMLDMPERDGIVKVKLDWGAMAFMNSGVVELARRRGRLSSSLPPNINKGAGQSNTDSVANRFLCTDLLLHKRFRRIIGQVRVQRALIDKINIKDAILSLWVHGRTSSGVTQQVEDGIKTWLKHYDIEKLDVWLTDREKNNVQESADIFLKSMEQFRLAKPPSAYYEPSCVKKEGEDLLADAMKFSLQRITKKSGEVRSVQVRKRGPPGSGRGKGAADRANKPTKTEKKSGLGKKRAPLTPVNPADQIKNPKALRVAELLRSLTTVLCTYLDLNQTSLAIELNRKYDVRGIVQTSISAWFRYRLPRPSTQRINHCIFNWLVFHKKLFPADHQARVDELSVLYKEVFGPDGWTMQMDEGEEDREEDEEEGDEEEGDQAEEEEGSELKEDDDGVEMEVEVPVALSPIKKKSSGTHHLLLEPEDDDEGKGEEEEEEEEEESKVPVAVLEPSSPLSTTDIVKIHEKRVAEPVPHTIPSDELIELMLKEVERRNLTHSYTASEASRLSYRIKQPSISKMAKEKFISDTAKGRMMKAALINWLNYSIQRPASDNDENAICSNCNKHKFAFTNNLAFLDHVMMCGKVKVSDPNQTQGMLLVSDDEDTYQGRGRRRYGRPPAVSKEKQEEEEQSMQSDAETEDVLTIRSEYEKKLQEGSAVVVRAKESEIDALSSTCKLCSKNVEGSPIRCATCHCACHPTCLRDSSKASGDEVWHCFTCLTNGSASAKTFASDQEKVRHCVAGEGLYVYCAERSVWRLATVVTTHSTQENLALVQWADAEKEHRWVDVFSANLLKPSRQGGDSTKRRRKRKRSVIDPQNVLDGKRSRLSSGAGKSNAVEEEERSDLESVDLAPKKKGRGGRPSKVAASVPIQSDMPQVSTAGEGMTDTYLGSQSLQAALCAAGSACKAVDVVMTQPGSNAFACTRPPGHHAGRYGCTRGCLSTGFCLLNNAAIALTYARVKYGVKRVAVVDIDVHFGNGTAEILKNDPEAFFASVHMVYGKKNDGHLVDGPVVGGGQVFGFYPAYLGSTEVTANYVSVGVQPASTEGIRERQQLRRQQRVKDEEEEEGSETEEGGENIGEDDDKSIMSIEIGDAGNGKQTGESDLASGEFVGPEGYLRAIRDVILPKLEAFQPELLIISAGFDGYLSDPLGNELKLSLEHYTETTCMLTASMDRVAKSLGQEFGGRVISLLEGGYDTSSYSLGLARCVDTHVAALQVIHPTL